MKTNNTTTMNKGADNIRLQEGVFHSDYIKTLSFKGNRTNKNYNFKFKIRFEYQERAFDDGTSFSGNGYSIYILKAPYFEWALDHNESFHFYSIPRGHESICWNRLIKSFQDANAVMYIWAKRYVNILEKMAVGGKIVMNNRVSLPGGTFRSVDYTVRMTKSTYDSIGATLGSIKPEQGGILGADNEEGIINYFVHDKTARVGAASYTPNTLFLNDVINGEWFDNNVTFIGFIHSHPGNFYYLSDADVEYAVRIMKALDYETLVMPIVTVRKKSFDIHFYVVDVVGNIHDCDFEMIDDDMLTAEDDFVEEVEEDEVEEICNESNQEDNQFTRINNSLPIEYLSNSTIIGVGCGGSRGLYVDLARMGVGNFYLIDGDIVSITNIGTQHTYLSEEGQYKAECIKKEILDINPNCNVVCINSMLDDNITDEFIENEILENIDINNTVLCGFTDSFNAQARVINIGYKYNIPVLESQHHKYGETSEITYYYPGVSEVNLFDILQDRYAAYQEGYKNDVTSEGGVIFGTTRLNALCEKLIIGMLLFKFNPNNVFSSFLLLRPEANLIIIKQYPIIFSELDSAFIDCEDLTFFDQPLWIDANAYKRDLEYIVNDTRKVNIENL